MAFIAANDVQTTPTFITKIASFFKHVGVSIINAQEARARREVRKYMQQSNRPL